MTRHAIGMTPLILASALMLTTEAAPAAPHTHHAPTPAMPHLNSASKTVAAAVVPAQILYDDPAFEQLVSPKTQLTRLYSKATWSEGPLVLADRSVIWSDVKQNEVLHWQPGADQHTGQVTVWLKPSDYQNGHAMDEQGRIVAASHGKRAIVRQESGQWQVLVDRHDGKRFNSPNDLIVDSTGAIWFSDPTFGVKNPQESYGGTIEQEDEHIYRFLPATGGLERMPTPEVKAPNGLAFSPDERTLYIADSERVNDPRDPGLAHHIIAYDVSPADRSLSNGRVFAAIDPGIPDGIKVDARGNVWSSSDDSVQVFAPDGRRLGRITFPATVGNLTFGKDQSGQTVLYVTAANGLYRLGVNVEGAAPFAH